MLVRYVRDYRKGNGKSQDSRVPVACLVAVSPDKFGISVCNEKDSFNKKRAREIAVARAYRGDSKINRQVPNRTICSLIRTGGSTVEFRDEKLNDAINRELAVLQERTSKYYNKKEALPDER